MAKIQINENDIKQMVYKGVVKVLNENNFKNYIKRRNAAIHAIGKKRGLSDDEIKQNMYDAMAKDQALKDINKDQLIRAQSKHEQKFKNPITNDTFNIDFDELNYYDPVYDDFSKNNKPMEGSDEEWWRGPNADDYLRESKIKRGIRITESNLKQMVNESVKRIINEHDVYDSEDDSYNDFLECLHELENIGNMINNFKSKYYLSKETAALLNQAIECLNKVGTEIHIEYM